MTAEQFTSGLETTCTECDRSFRIVTKYERREVNGKPNGETVSFSCPHCGHRWPVAHVSERGLGVRRRLAEAQERNRRSPSAGNEAAVVRLTREMAEETTRLSGARELTP